MKQSSKFLVSGLAAAAHTANAIKPVARQGRASLPAFAFGVVPSEWPTQSSLVQLGTAALLARRGGLKGWKGARRPRRLRRVGGRPRLHAPPGGRGGRASSSRPWSTNSAATTAIGFTSTWAPKPEVPLTRKQLVLPDVAVRRRYRHARNISYGDYGVRNQLDVWRRADLPLDGKAPVLFQVHGGAWMVGMKEGQAETTMAHLAERGWVIVTTNYRLSPRSTWPDHIVDVKKALAWTKANIAEYGGDPDFVAITGGSAGGHLASLAALTPNLADFQPGFEDADTTVQAGVPFYGVYDFVNRHGTSRADMESVLGKHVLKSRCRRTAPAGSRRRRSATSARTRRRCSCCTAPTTRSCRWSRRAPSSTNCARSRPTTSCTRSYRVRSTRSRSCRRCGPTPRRTRSSGSSRSCAASTKPRTANRSRR